MLLQCWDQACHTCISLLVVKVSSVPFIVSINYIIFINKFLVIFSQKKREKKEISSILFFKKKTQNIIVTAMLDQACHRCTSLLVVKVSPMPFIVSINCIIFINKFLTVTFFQKKKKREKRKKFLVYYFSTKKTQNKTCWIFLRQCFIWRVNETLN